MTTDSQGLLLIISGPSGVGKTTLTHRVREALQADLSVSMTTRPAAPGDREGVDYRFVDKATFEAMRDAGGLLEWAQVFDNYYGTPRGPVEEALAAGRLMILEIDVQGACQVRAAMPHAMGIFILPPSEEVLLERLRGRKREDESVIQRRFAKARAEISRARECGAYDHFIVNDDLDRAVAESLELIQRFRERAPAPRSGK